MWSIARWAMAEMSRETSGVSQRAEDKGHEVQAYAGELLTPAVHTQFQLTAGN